MKLTDELVIKIAKKYNFVYDEDFNDVLVPQDIRIDDEDFTFMRIYTTGKNRYDCAYEFGITAFKSGKFGYHTTSFQAITTTEEFEENIKNFLSFIELVKPLEKKYAEQTKLNKMGGDF